MFAASKTDSASTGGYQISRSLRFNSADSAYLNRTPASSGNLTTWTISWWTKRGQLSTPSQTTMFGTNYTSTQEFMLQFRADNKFAFEQYTAGGATYLGYLVSTQVFRDPSAWYHFVVTYDSTQATASDRIKIYVNGTQITAFDTASYPAQNGNSVWNSNVNEHRIGQYSTAKYYDGLMTETNFIDGQALTPSSFGETNAQTGVWQPKAYSGSYGTNGFYLNFSDNSNTTAATLGKDYSGNGNNWTPNNFSVTAGAGNDSLVDSPTSYGTDTGVGGTVRGNYATVNPLQLISNVVVSNGNLFLQSNNNQDQWASAPSTIAVRTGKWYAEFTPTNVAGSPDYMFGVVRATWSPIILDGGGYYGRFWYTTEGYSYYSNGSFYTGNSIVSSGASYVTSNVVGVALDLDAGSITFYKNGVSQGTPFTSIPLGVDYVFAGGAFTTPYPTPTNIGSYFANFGQRPFAYTAPSGYKALCTQNLPTPTIGATSTTLAGKYFDTSLYTGNAGALTVTNSGFQPDFLWIKRRDASGPYHNAFDSVRGVNKILFPNVTDAEYTSANYLTSFNSGGFTLGAGDTGTNANGATYVGWQWRAGNSSGSTNTAGSITSTVSANTTSGFSVVTYTGTGSNATVGHGLGVAPSFIIVKRRDAGSSWNCYQANLGASQYIQIDGTAGAATNTGVWNNTAPTSTVFSIGTAFAGVNASGSTHVAYCFAPIAGYSAFGSYTGNGSSDGPFIFTGFKPAFVLIKSSTVVGSSWRLWDAKRSTYNVVNSSLFPNLSNAEVSTADYAIDFLSNGIKIRAADDGQNYSGGTFIYAAFASVPFKFSLAQ